jgi:hypothetical protein
MSNDHVNPMFAPVLHALQGLVPRTRRYVDCVCIRCARKVTADATDATPGELRVVCFDCAQGDRPSYKPNTGW